MRLTLSFCLVALALATACGGGPDLRPSLGEATDTPLPPASPAEPGLPSGVWAGALAEAEAQGMKIDQIGLMVGGRLVAAHHREGHSETTLHDLRSATKSVTSLLAGIAIDRGLITDADATVDSFFPEWPPHASRAAWRPLTVRDLLTMRTGLDCDDWNAASRGNEERMYASGHWIRFFQDLPVAQAPGTTFSYCTAGVVVLGEIVARASGQPLPAFARQALFEPLGIRNARWADAGAGITDAGGHLRLSLASMLKLGELARSSGVWQGQRIVSRAWLDASLRSTGTMRPEETGSLAHMGRLWWLEPVDADGAARSYQARGNGGQLLIVVPEVELVVAVTGRAYNDPPRVQWAPFQLLQRWFIPALRGQTVPAGPR
jgi:CubicO group peptidase (beta-lactamase class C family)